MIPTMPPADGSITVLQCDCGQWFNFALLDCGYVYVNGLQLRWYGPPFLLLRCHKCGQVHGFGNGSANQERATALAAAENATH